MSVRRSNAATCTTERMRAFWAMEWILIAGIALTGIGILVGLYLPILAA
jgi:hypothetical protein